MGAKHAVIVTGSRDWTDDRAIGKALRALPDGAVLIHGDATGADSLAHMVADHMPLIRVRVSYFGWLGRAGGAARNTHMKKMLLMYRDAGYTVEVLAFHDDLYGESKGTRNMVEQAKRAGIKVKHYRHRGKS